MPELLIELFSEEIPARMQAKAAEDLRQLVTNALVDAGLAYEGAQAHGGARRLTLSVEGLNAKAADVAEERKGPRVDAPQQAIDGFLKSTGLTLDQLTLQDDKKGKFYVAVIRKAGRAATDVIAEIVPHIIRSFPWPKSMRWGAGSLRWVRPLKSIVCTFDGEVVPFAVDGIVSGNVTRGHRIMGGPAFTVRRFEDYAQKLYRDFVIVDAAARAETIRTEARNLAFAQGLEMIEDEGLLRETAGLVEWPVVLMGSFDESFLSVPPEVIATSIKTHQKCKLADWAAKLDAITFHARLGSQGERVTRIAALAGEIARAIGADVAKAELAARLAKADLVTGMVGEFPELQGLMGRYYALDQGIDPEVADAIRDHYKPAGPSDTIPASRVGQAVALADKLDTLVGFWAIDEKPTGSKDPYALRRAALGVIRIILDKNLRVPMNRGGGDLLAFFADRLKVHLKEQGARHDLIDAVFALGNQDDLLLIVRRVDALSKFLETDDGRNLLAGVKRAANILRIEEKKDGKTYEGDVHISQLIKGEEKALHSAITVATGQTRRAIEQEDFEGAMAAIAKLRAPVDAFFEHVTVNDKDATFRENRLRLLNRIRQATLDVADFSRIEG